MPGESSLPVSEISPWAIALRAPEVKIHPRNARVSFAIRFCGVTTVRGVFEDFAGVVRYADDDNTHSFLAVEIQAASVNTGSRLRDRHLRSARYLDVATHPLIAFQSSAVVRCSACLAVRGALSMRGVTEEVEIACTLGHADGDWSVSGDGHAGCRSDVMLVGDLAVRRATYGVGRPSPVIGRFDPRSSLLGEEIRIRMFLRPFVP